MVKLKENQKRRIRIQALEERFDKVFVSDSYHSALVNGLKNLCSKVPGYNSQLQKRAMFLLAVAEQLDEPGAVYQALKNGRLDENKFKRTGLANKDQAIKIEIVR